jgi:surface antigen
MLLYPLQEAIDLLETKLSGAEKSLEETIEDLEWLREQVTVMEVNFARVHNVSHASLHSCRDYSHTVMRSELR